MGIEFLENAARAAGFAMAAEEQAENERVVTGTWQAGYAPQGEEYHDKLVEKAQASFSDWVKGVVGGTGRGAPA